MFHSPAVSYARETRTPTEGREEEVLTRCASDQQLDSPLSFCGRLGDTSGVTRICNMQEKKKPNNSQQPARYLQVLCWVRHHVEGTIAPASNCSASASARDRTRKTRNKTLIGD
ncbi:hypothetical protein NW761_003748 [Fusarium oxysporum]|nr:hypothetical protein NW758_011771 [Fusarium oxysporum]KAJ4065863.1 hypothetical protein NW763_002891 [Fusarium oxysporum]KAJ4091860.1 hypothetical protein NW756_006073 [Fusarium oxysporum]KAJ4097619.1 hypothetical protein NW761_003748 [Fusarium oxysporum]